ncbi:MAG: A/G-specific adenine glycosylase [Bacteroidota bacterium]
MPNLNWTFFRQALLDWYEPERRPMPWKGLRDPYLIWLSEIILQQTRVEQGWPYFERFRAAYPTVADLAAAEEDEVLRLWQGLGYYSRGRNLLKAARMVMSDFAGVFPATLNEIRQLPGVGPYTGAAIASFAYDLAVAVVDGNVYRVLSRYANEPSPIDTTTGKKLFAHYAESALGTAQAAQYNQAIMDFGALICTPKKPRCPSCPLQTKCAAFQHGTTSELPVKSKKIKRRERFFYFLLLSREDEILLQRRGEGDIWTGLYQLPLIELPQEASTQLNISDLPLTDYWPEWLPAAQLEWRKNYPPRSQQLTHQKIIGQFSAFSFKGKIELPEGTQWVNQQKIENHAFPKLIDDFFREKALYLDLF